MDFCFPPKLFLLIFCLRKQKAILSFSFIRSRACATNILEYPWCTRNSPELLLQRESDISAEPVMLTKLSDLFLNIKLNYFFHSPYTCGQFSPMEFEQR